MRLSDLHGEAIRETIRNFRDFTQPSPGGCSMCRGIGSESLILIPCLYMIGQDVYRSFRRKRRSR